jgi:ribulose-5-phosphate 4-epimerase/fuculose-1-phosphate aldolase
VTVRDEEGARLLANLGSKRVMLLRNHGILVMGRTLPEAFIKHWSLQRACEIQVATLGMGEPLMVADEVVAVHQRDLYQAQAPGGPGHADFEAWKRKIDSLDSSWRD